jgi:hypothetical protein
MKCASQQRTPWKICILETGVHLSILNFVKKHEIKDILNIGRAWRERE